MEKLSSKLSAKSKGELLSLSRSYSFILSSFYLCILPCHLCGTPLIFSKIFAFNNGGVKIKVVITFFIFVLSGIGKVSCNSKHLPLSNGVPLHHFLLVVKVGIHIYFIPYHASFLSPTPPLTEIWKMAGKPNWFWKTRRQGYIKPFNGLIELK